MLSTLGVWKGLEGVAQPILEIKVSDGRAGEGAAPWFLHFDHRDIDEGPMGQMVEDRHLRSALLAAMDASGRVEHRAGVRVVDHEVSPGGIDVHLDDGSRLGGMLVVGCDGRASAVARRAGIRRIGRDYSQTALVCAVEHDLPHDGIAHQFFMPAGPLAILPLRGNRSSIVWTETTARAEAIGGLGPKGYLAELRPRFGEFLGAIRLAGIRHSYPLALSIARSFTAERVALAGDAAHGIHPLAGQGLNLGLRDVAALAEVLVAARRRGEDLGNASALDAYARWRRTDTALLVAATDGIDRLFSNDNMFLRLGRDLGLGLVDRLPALRRGLIREAAGLTGDIPRLLLGRPI
jgi:2-octaprenyl-6-methoxyphenol hydroxylase